MVVRKYTLRSGINEISMPMTVDPINMPESASLLHIGIQAEQVQLWALVDETNIPRETRRIGVYKTGQPIPDHERLRYIGTAILHESPTLSSLFGPPPSRVAVHVFELCG